ncbi:hypothetical protein B7P43_G16065 [Cryptotermes secundus]|uniref:Uncharacterized protein n=1 Tax=Cryptotermes secundus TaxID=105785 RepID=A0A2J7PTL1_9NEOP|nr:hypothetical protein B7P43_G16065 [Cryptotermes secundus]
MLHPQISFIQDQATEITYANYKDFIKRKKSVSESSWTITVVTALVKDDERGGQGHTSTSLLQQSAM